MDQNGSYVSVTPVTIIKWALLVSQFQSHHAKPCLVFTLNFFLKKEECMHGVQKKIYLRNLFIDRCNFSRRI